MSSLGIKITILSLIFKKKPLHEKKNFRLTKICEKGRKDHIFVSFRVSITRKYHVF